MNNWRAADPRDHQQRVPYADAAVRLCLFLVTVRPRLRLRSHDGLFWAEIRIQCHEANLTTPHFVTATFPAMQAGIATAQRQVSKSPRRISDIVPASLHAPQRQRWLPDRRDMLLESS